MKILLVNTYTDLGGAARATQRIFEGLLEQGANVNLLTEEGLSNQLQKGTSHEGLKYLTRKITNKIRRQIDRLPLMAYPRREKASFASSSTPDWLANSIQRLNPDVIHLNWISDGFMRIESLAALNRPLLWTLHDAWPFTGGCHYTSECQRFSANCGACPQLHSKSESDLSRKIWERKSKSWSNADITLIAPSRWMASEARKSSLFRKSRIEVVPNGLDTRVFRPIEKKTARRLLGLPYGKKLILFGALGATTDSRKGFHFLQTALQQIADDSALSPELEFVIFGCAKNEKKPEIKIPSTLFERIDNDERLATLYSACDIMVVPSTEESFGQTASEAMACGTPVVAFASTGLLDIVDHLSCGYLARPFDPLDLAGGIRYLLSDRARLEEFSNKARQKVATHYGLDRVARLYLEIYQQIATPHTG